MPTIQRGKAEAIELNRQQREKIADNTEMKGRRYRIQEGAEGGRLLAIQRGKAEAIKLKRQPRGEDYRQYEEEGQML